LLLLINKRLRVREWTNFLQTQYVSVFTCRFACAVQLRIKHSSKNESQFPG
jgi:hypothetical protein